MQSLNNEQNIDVQHALIELLLLNSTEKTLSHDKL